MLHWDNNDIPGLEDLELQLASVFRDIYKFFVELITIPSSHHNPSSFFQDTLFDFRRQYQGPSSLMIHVYSGHAEALPPSYDKIAWFGMRHPSEPRIQWSGGYNCRSISDIAVGDTLYILDCCYAAIAAVDAADNEHLVAASMESVTGSAIQTSFTNKLVELLRIMNGAPATIVQIHTELVSNIRSANTSMEFTPVHIGAKAKSSICLKSQQIREIKALQALDTKGAGKVLVSLSLQEKSNLLDVQRFQDWLLSNLPPSLASARVEAVFRSSSNLILFTIPLEIWDCLGETGGFQFFDFVDSHNLLPENPLGECPTPALAIRRKENIPFQESSKSRRK